MAKDSVVNSLIPPTLSECSLILNAHGEHVCSSQPVIREVASALGICGKKGSEEIIASAKETTQCTSERCVLNKLRSKLGNDVVENELETRFKISGPTGTELLSNVNIDSTLKQWMAYFPKFFAYNFNMSDYHLYSFRNGRVVNEPDTLATLDWRRLAEKYNTCACIINTDVYYGAGKHWMALFADWRSPKEWTIEFFNSSGRPPSAEWIEWMTRTEFAMKEWATAKKLNVCVKVIRTATIKQQHSRSECGVYSLFYVWARINGVPHTYFSKHSIPDAVMFEFRAHLFGSQSGVKFNFANFAKTHTIDWEQN